MISPATKFFIDAYLKLSNSPETKEEIRYIKWILDKGLENTAPEQFFEQYVWCVLNAGMKEQVARKIWERYLENLDPLTIGHLGKRKAIETGLQNYVKWFGELKCAKDPVEYLQTLPWIGPITKYHLARNIGIDCVKPDRHLERLAKQFGYTDPFELCKTIQKEIGGSEMLGTIDLVLWRISNLYGSER